MKTIRLTLLIVAMATGMTLRQTAFAQDAAPAAAAEEKSAEPAKEAETEKKDAPAPAATPTPEPELKEPVPTPTPDPKVGKQDLKAVPEEPAKPVNWHEATHPSVANKLSLGMNASVGKGTGPDYSSDTVGFGIYANYVFKTDVLKDGDKLFAEFRYVTTTGVEVKKDISRVVHYYLFGAGHEFQFKQESKFSFAYSALVALTRKVGLEQATSTITDTGFGVGGGVNVRTNYQLVEKIFAFGGVGAYFGSYSWYAVEAGFGASF